MWNFNEAVDYTRMKLSHAIPKTLTPAGIALLYVAFAALWIVSTGSLLSYTVSDPVLQSRIEFAKGLLFVFVTGGLLYIILKAKTAPSDAGLSIEELTGYTPRPARLILLFMALALIVPAAGVIVLQLQSKQVERVTFSNLTAIAQLKSGQIENWLSERQGDAKLLSFNHDFAAHLEQFKRNGNAGAQQSIAGHLSIFKDSYGYTGIMLLDTDGRLMLMLGDQDDRPDDLPGEIRQALATGKIQRSPLYRDETGNVHLDWVTPVFAQDARGEHPVAVVVLRATAGLFLYPTIQTWPTASDTAETLLVRRDGDSVVFLNDLRHRQGTALILRPRLDTPDLPASIAIRANKPGVTTGTDYRGKKVLAAYRPIAGTDWFLVAKVDRDEVMVPLQEMVFMVSFVAFSAVIVLTVAILLLWRQQRRMQNLVMKAQQAEVAQKLNAADASLQQSMERTHALVDSALDAIISVDQNDKVVAWNPQAENIFGYPAAEAIGKSVSNLIIPPMHREAHRQGMARFISSGQATIIGKRTEIQAMRADGSIFPVELTLSSLVQNGEHYFSSYIRDISDRKKAEETIYDLAFYDPLTHLPNRRLMLDRLKQTLLSSTRQQRYGAILFIDLDDFKTLNDTKGHEIGDMLLVEITRQLLTAVHADDTVARIGGDEFVVVLDTLDVATEVAAKQAQSVAERILAAINQPHDLQGHEYHCSASIGITLFLDHEITMEDLLKHADVAMHQAKQSGRNTIHFFDPKTQAALESRVQMESWMRKSLNNHYKLFYQKQVNEDGRTTGAEALIRWIHPEKGMISPAEFIPLAEETGLILPIGQWVIETACAQLKAWEQEAGTRHLMIAVNVSARQFHQNDFVNQVLSVLDKSGADPEKLKLELTESMLVNDVEGVISKMMALKSRGVKFSLDDFGTGFSSLSYLKRLPLNQLKIDQSFVRDALTDPNDAAIIRTVIALGQSMGMEVIAEGVETEAHQNFLAVHGCHLYQGYLFGKPMSLEDFEASLL